MANTSNDGAGNGNGNERGIQVGDRVRWEYRPSDGQPGYSLYGIVTDIDRGWLSVECENGHDKWTAILASDCERAPAPEPAAAAVPTPQPATRDTHTVELDGEAREWCHECDNTGSITYADGSTDPCRACDGTGYTWLPHTIRLTPAALDTLARALAGRLNTIPDFATFFADLLKTPQP